MVPGKILFEEAQCESNFFPLSFRFVSFPPLFASLLSKLTIDLFILFLVFKSLSVDASSINIAACFELYRDKGDGRREVSRRGQGAALWSS